MMKDAALYPLRFEPILRRLIWGGRRLGTVLHKPIGRESDYAESWEISDYHDQVSKVEGGPLAGTTLRELMAARPRDLLGGGLEPAERFPLLVKFIDAHQDLSVQVHPDDDRGRRLAGDSGKTETWVILEADPGSLIYAGLRRGVQADEFRQAIDAGTVEPLLHRFEARPGDSILIEAGTVHAIGAGVLLAEIQQMSDATFRVFDWNRVGDDGKPRTLHIEQAMESIDFNRGPVNPIIPGVEDLGPVGKRERLTRSRYFELERLTLRAATTVGRDDRFTILMGLAGSSNIFHAGVWRPLEYGCTVLVPAAIGSCQIVPSDGEAVVLSCVVP